MKLLVQIVLLFFVFGNKTFSQSVFSGGVGDGAVTSCYAQATNLSLAIFNGGSNDGYSTSSYVQGDNLALAIYKGGPNDGYAMNNVGSVGAEIPLGEVVYYTVLNSVLRPTQCNDHVVFQQDYTVAIDAGSTREIGFMTVESGVTLTVNSLTDLSVCDKIINKGLIIVEENASLIQQHTGVDENYGSGTYQIKRTGNTSPNVFNVWSSPIQAAVITNVFSSANPCDIWTFDKQNQNWTHDFPVGYTASCNGNNVTFSANDVISGGDGIMDVSEGYFIPGHVTSQRVFSGTINNGDILKPIKTTSLINPGGVAWGDDDWNLIGNPYPSALNANAFWAENSTSHSRIKDALYYWDEGDTTNGFNQYSDYASWNLSGGVNSGNSLQIPNGEIASGQGFWVVANANTNIVFNNVMRSNVNSMFFKTTENKSQHNAWISFTSPSNYQNNILIGYNNETTDGVDNGYDAHKLVGNSHVKFASLIDSSEFVIQSFAAFNIGGSKTIPLIVSSDESGLHVFNLYNTLNIPQNLNLYILDDSTNVKHNLSLSSYAVSLRANGEYKNRFSLLFVNEITKNNNGGSTKGGNNNSDSTVVTDIDILHNRDFEIIQNKDYLILENVNGLKGTLKILDVLGRTIFTQEMTEGSISLRVNWRYFSSGSYFIHVYDKSNQYFTKKVFKQ